MFGVLIVPLMLMINSLPVTVTAYQTSVAGEAIGVLLLGWQLMSVV
jgi:hypothetical protein